MLFLLEFGIQILGYDKKSNYTLNWVGVSSSIVNITIWSTSLMVLWPMQGSQNEKSSKTQHFNIVLIFFSTI